MTEELEISRFEYFWRALLGAAVTLITSGIMFIFAFVLSISNDVRDIQGTVKLNGVIAVRVDERMTGYETRIDQLEEDVSYLRGVVLREDG